MPLYNYAIGDLVKAEDGKEQVVNPSSISSFQGRIKDVVITESGPVCLGEIDSTIASIDTDIAQYQVVAGAAEIKLFYTMMSSDDLTLWQKQLLKDALEQKLQLPIKFRLRKYISPEASGKFSIIKNISHLT